MSSQTHWHSAQPPWNSRQVRRLSPWEDPVQGPRQQQPTPKGFRRPGVPCRSSTTPAPTRTMMPFPPCLPAFSAGTFSAQPRTPAGSKKAPPPENPPHCLGCFWCSNSQQALVTLHRPLARPPAGNRLWQHRHLEATIQPSFHLCTQVLGFSEKAAADTSSMEEAGQKCAQ